MKPRKKPTIKTSNSRRAISNLVSVFRKRPFELLPERSIEAVKCFFDGYSVHAGWNGDMELFSGWVMKQLFYPKDTGAGWWRAIQLNARDNFEGFELFLNLYQRFVREVPRVPDNPPKGVWQADKNYDFYSMLYALSNMPGFWFSEGKNASVNLLAAFLSGYFTAKRGAGFKLSRDEKEFFRFADWQHRTQRIGRYPWYRVADMWRYGGLGSLESFFANYDAYLTDYGKKPRGLEDRYEYVDAKPGRRVQKRKVLPKKLVKLPGTRRWWRPG